MQPEGSSLCGLPHVIKITFLKIPHVESYKSIRRPSHPNFISKSLKKGTP